MYNNLQRFGSTAKPWTLAVLLASVFPTASNAFEFSNETGSVTGSFDTTISLSAAWRAQDRDPKLIGITNGGTARDVNSDDGNLNFDQRDLISSIAKVTHEFDLAYQNYGFFARGFYFYDHVGSEKEALGPKARDLTGSEAELRDAYVRASYNPGGRALNLRLGAQVVSWGESTFIPNGVNIINPIDLKQFRTPGSQLRDALIAMPLLWGSRDITDNINIEALILGDHDKVRLDPRGTFFSTTDVASDDGDRIFIGSGRRIDQHGLPGNPFPLPDAAVWAPRSPDRNPSDNGEFGLALRLFSPGLNNTEFGVFAVHYHSRTPIFSATRGAATVTGTAGLGAVGCPNGSTLVNFNALLALITPLNPGGNPLGQGACSAGGAPLVQANYFLEYPEDIRLYGLSFNTQGPAGIAIQGEWSYRPNQPIQLATTEVILAAGGLANNITSNGLTGSAANSAAGGVVPGTKIQGFRRIEMNQIQTTLTKAFGPTLGSNQLIAVGEIGYTHLDLPDDLLFAGPGIFLPAQGSSTATTAGSNQPGNDGYATRNSWGYRVLARMDFNSAVGAATLSPRIAFSHDVDGVGPTFNEDTKAITVGLGYNLRQVWQADLAYTSFYGGRTYVGVDPNPVPSGQSPSFATSANPLKDRDFVAFTLSYAF